MFISNSFHLPPQQANLIYNNRKMSSSMPEFDYPKGTSPKSMNYNLSPVEVQAVEGLREQKFPLASSYLEAQRLSENCVELKSKSISHIRRVVVIGDSHSDTGALHSRVHGRLVPPSKYFDGRFSNGYVWPELLSAPAFLNHPKLRPGEESPLKLLNLSEGGATITSFSKRWSPILRFLTNIDKQIKSISKVASQKVLEKAEPASQQPSVSGEQSPVNTPSPAENEKLFSKQVDDDPTPNPSDLLF